MKADSFFMAAKASGAHPVCQDYATVDAGGPSTQTREGVFYADDGLMAVVSDGCSKARGSDVGARLLARGFVTEYSRLRRLGTDHGDVIKNHHEYMLAAAAQANVWRQGMGLPLSYLNATCAYACVNDGQYVAGIGGDGLLVMAYSNGRKIVMCLDYPGPYANAPAYPYYALDESLLAAYAALPPNELRIRTIVFDDAWQPIDEMTLSNSKTAWRGPTDELDYIAVCTDGIYAVHDQASRRPLAVGNTLEILCRFPIRSGACVQRSANIMRTAVHRNEIELSDDIAMSVIFLKEHA